MAIWRMNVDLAWTGAGSPGTNVWHLRTVDGGGDTAQLQGVVDDVHDFYEAALTIQEGTQGVWAAGLTATLGQVVDVDTDEVGTVDWEPVVARSNGIDAPPIAQVVVSWRTSTAGARGRGRTFMGPLSSAAVAADGTPTAFFLAGLRGAASALVSASTAGEGDSVVVYGRAAKGSENRVGRDIVGSSVRNQFASLRSRRD